MITNSQKLKKKRAQISWSAASLFCFFALVLAVFIIVIYHSHLQLGMEDVPSKSFVFSRLNPFSRQHPAQPSAVEGPNSSLIATSTMGENTAPSQSSSLFPAPPPVESSPNDKQPVNSAQEETGLQSSSAGEPFDPRKLPPDVSYYRLNCLHGHLMSYWRPPTEADLRYVSPFASHGPPNKYVTFEPDVGGWNNIRMQMELVLVFAYATGRTLVLPPDQPMYLLQAGKGHQKAHSFADFFPFEKIKERVPVLSMEEFMAKEAVTGHLRRNDSAVLYPPGNKTVFEGMNREERLGMWAYLRQVAACPKWKGLEQYLIIPHSPASSLSSSSIDPAQQQAIEARRARIAANRTAQFYDSYWQDQPVIHFISKPELGYRLLEHFYTFLHFDDPAMDKLYKRFVRDYVHYQRDILCKTALVVNKLRTEGNGSYIGFHIRRGEFQYKVVKISAEKMIDNLKSVLPRDRLVFVATDERNKTFFDAFKRHFPQVRFLDDYMISAGLKELNPNYLGMIDQMICTRAEYFVGTWFSTFSGYITRVRGYMGYPDRTTFYGDKGHR